MGRRRDEETRSDNRGKERSTKRHRDDGSDSKKEKRRKRSRSRSSSSSSSDSLADERRKRDRKEKDRRHHRHKRDRERESRNERRRSRSRSRSRKRESRVNEDSGPKSGSNETEKGRFANSGKNDRMDTGSSSQNQNNDDAVDDETRRIEIAMQRRRERLEQWRREKQLDTKGGDEQHKSAGGAHPATSAAASGADAEKREALDLIKAWSFENDDEDDDDQIQAPLETAVSGDVNGSTTHSSATPSVASNKDKDKHVPVTSQEPDAASEANATLMESEESKPSTQNVAPTSTKRIVAIDDEVDPLDAYMMEVNREVSGLLRKVQKAQQVTTVRDTKNTTTDGLLTARAPVAKVIRIVTKAEQAAKSTPAGENDNETQMAATNSRTDAEEGGSKKLLIAKRPGFASNSNSRVKGEDESLDESVKQKKAKMAKRMPSDDEDGDAKDDDDEDALRALVTNSDARKVKLNKVDHSQVEYPPFRKAFYVETHEIAQMNAEGVLQLRTELDGIRVTGRKCPKPIRAWSQAGVNVRVLQVLKEAGFERPTPIQAQALPIIMCGRDLIGIAKTGSGKTLAFLLPLFRHALDQPPLEAGDGPIGLIMTPTRELAVQICRDSRPFARALNLRAVAVYGGTGISEQIAELKRGAEIVVATPGRLIDLLAANGGRVTNLRRVTYVVLDEADRMFDLGFEPQVMRILENVRPDRQCVMFSATFPIQMEILARKTLQKPIEVQVGGRSVVCNDVEQLVFVLEEGQKFLKLLELLGVHQELGSVIVFVEKQEHADELLSALLKHGYTCLALHGGLDQYDRDSVIDDFKKGIVRLLVATSVAARGLDVKHLCLVVNYDPPNHYEDYVHRCGRTGRAGNKGVACTFVTPADERHSGEIIRALQASAATVPAELQRLFDSYKQRMEAAGRKVKVGGSAGFTRGKGFKFDEREKELTDVKRRLQTVALGLADEADLGLGLDQTSEGAARTEQIDAAIEGRFTEIRMNDGTNSTNSNSTNAGASASASSGAAASNAAATGGPLTPAQFGRGFTSQPASSTAEVQQKLELARQTAAQIAAAKQQDALERNVEAVHSAADLKNKKTAAALTAEKLNEKLGYRTVQTTAELAAQNATLGTSQPGTSSDAQAVNESDADYYERLQREAASRQKQDERFSTEFEINDFPEYIRMKLCTRKVLTQIEEYCDVCITVKGVFVPPKRAPKEGERKLYLTVEANREFNIMSAKHELIRLIKEEGLRQKSTFQAINKGRYKVV